MDFDKLQKLAHLFVCAMATQVEVEAMKALNQQRQSQDYSQAYDESEFWDKAQELSGIAQEIKNIK